MSNVVSMFQPAAHQWAEHHHGFNDKLILGEASTATFSPLMAINRSSSFIQKQHYIAGPLLLMPIMCQDFSLSTLRLKRYILYIHFLLQHVKTIDVAVHHENRTG